MQYTNSERREFIIWSRAARGPCVFLASCKLDVPFFYLSLLSCLWGKPSSAEKRTPRVGDGGGGGRHEGLLPRNDDLSSGFIRFSLARTLERIFFVPRLPHFNNFCHCSSLRQLVMLELGIQIREMFTLHANSYIQFL